MSPAQFLADYWQKRPLLIRGAMPNFSDLLTPDELAGLAMQDGVSARLVLERGGRRPWQLEHGPFSEERLTALPKSHWSLLVSNVEQWLESGALILDQFSFVPHWRADDLMVSFAPTGGSVGPHVDSYDVFLLQGMGSRRWQIAEQGDRTLVSGVDLKILKKFQPEAEWVLEPGDMLYLPPGVAHYGVASADCMTYSIGFRAPAQRDLLEDFYNLPKNLMDLVTTDQMYGDPDLALQSNPGEITQSALVRVEDILRAPLAHNDLLGRWFGAHVTRLPGASKEPSRRRMPAESKLNDLLKSDRKVWRSDRSRFAFFAPAGATIYFYVDGDELAVPQALKPLLEALCASRCNAGRALAATLPRGKSREQALLMLRQMLAHGSLYMG